MEISSGRLPWQHQLAGRVRHQDRRLEGLGGYVWCAPLPDERSEWNFQLLGLAGREGLERWDVEDLDGSRTMSNDQDMGIWNAYREGLVFYSRGRVVVLSKQLELLECSI